MNKVIVSLLLMYNTQLGMHLAGQSRHSHHGVHQQLQLSDGAVGLRFIRCCIAL